MILDTSVLTAVARGDADIIALVQEYEVRGQPIVVPALAIAGASLGIRSQEGDDLLAGLELLEVVTVAPLSDAEQSAWLAHLDDPLHIIEIAGPGDQKPGK